MDGSPSQGVRSLRKATDPYDPTIVHITLLVAGTVPILLRVGVRLRFPNPRERIFIELMTSDRQLNASREGSK